MLPPPLALGTKAMEATLRLGPSATEGQFQARRRRQRLPLPLLASRLAPWPPSSAHRPATLPPMLNLLLPPPLALGTKAMEAALRLGPSATEGQFQARRRRQRLPLPLLASRLAPWPPSSAHRPATLHSMKISQLQITATRFSKENNSDKDDEFLSGLKDKWDDMGNKSSVAVYGAGAIITIWISLVLVRSLDSVPLLPGLLELVGLSYSGWFVYRYLLFQENRKELGKVIDDIRRRMIGYDD